MRGQDGRDLLIWQLRAEIAQRDATIAQRDATIAWLQASLDQRDVQLAEAAERIAQLQATVHRHFKEPRPKPPGGTTPPPKRPRRSQRQRGAQPGHPGHARPLLAIDRVSQVVPRLPPTCDGCGRTLCGSDPDPLRHQVVEVPPLLPQITEYQLGRLSCPACGVQTRAKLPLGVPSSAFGPRLCSMLGILSGKYHLSKRMVEELMADFLGVELSLGSVSRIEQMVSAALAQPVAEATDSVKNAAIVHQDETGWRQQNGRAWLWVVVTQAVTVFLIDWRRSKKVCAQMIGESFSGTLITDRWSAYRWVDDSQRQLCWSHLKRDFEELEAVGGNNARLGQALLVQVRRLFRYWHRARDHTLERSEFTRKMQPVRRAVRNLLHEGVRWHTGKAQTLSKKLLRHEPALWHFVNEPDCEPTNNRAERALRQAVLWRRGSFGTQSAGGSEFVQRILTVVATLRQQGRNVLEYLTAACQSHLHHLPAPSLLQPPPDRLHASMA